MQAAIAPRKAVRMIEGRHLTAADKRNILAVIEKAGRGGSTARRTYTIEHIEAERYAVEIQAFECDDWNRPVTRRQKCTVEILGGKANA